MDDTQRYPYIGQGNDAPYFPPTYQRPDCGRCEKRKECFSCGKYQRDRRDFTYTSGRCPRLPDYRGFVDRDERDLYAHTFPFIHAERGGVSVSLSLSLPDAKRLKKVYRTYGSWWFRDGKDEYGYLIRRCLTMEHSFQNEQEIFDYMEDRNWDYILIRVDVLDSYL